MIETLVVLVLILWLFGFVVHPVGSLVHILLVVALVLIVVRLLRGQRIG